ncbi:hypothetical protein YC2023_073068 [Brassica napus]
MEDCPYTYILPKDHIIKRCGTSNSPSQDVDGKRSNRKQPKSNISDISQNAQPGTMKEVLSFCLEQTCSSAYKSLSGSLKFELNLVDDVIHLQRLIFGALQEVKSSGRGLKKKLKLADRKVFFMTCWVNEQTQTPELLSCSSKFNSRK